MNREKTHEEIATAASIQGFDRILMSVTICEPDARHRQTRYFTAGSLRGALAQQSAVMKASEAVDELASHGVIRLAREEEGHAVSRESCPAG